MSGALGSPLVRRSGLAWALALALALLVPAAAAANTTCNYDSGSETLQVFMGAPNDSTILSLNGTEIRVNQSSGPVTCTNGPGTFANSEFISVTETGGGTATVVSILEPAKFADDVGILLANAGGQNALLLIGSAGADHFVIGNGGVDGDGDGDKDVSFFAKPEQIQAAGGAGEDVLDAQGGSGTGTAVTGSFLNLTGETEGDVLDGGEAADLLDGGLGNDILRGRGGKDRLLGDASVGVGDDVIEGGADSDTFGLPFNVSDALTIDLGKAGPQATGYGTDTISAVENADGTSANDTLIGNAEANVLQAGAGDDTVEGKGGNDILEGSIGADTTSYASAAAGVVVNLGLGTASGGDGNDTVTQFESVVGSALADALTGSDAANTIDPKAGGDVVQASAAPISSSSATASPTTPAVAPAPTGRSPTGAASTRSSPIARSSKRCRRRRRPPAAKGGPKTRRSTFDSAASANRGWSSRKRR